MQPLGHLLGPSPRPFPLKSSMSYCYVKNSALKILSQLQVNILLLPLQRPKIQQSLVMVVTHGTTTNRLGEGPTAITGGEITEAGDSLRLLIALLISSPILSNAVRIVTEQGILLWIAVIAWITPSKGVILLLSLLQWQPHSTLDLIPPSMLIRVPQTILLMT